MVLLLAQGLAVFIFLHALLGRVYGTRSFSWDLLNHESERARSLTICDSLHISIAPLSNYGDIGRAPYTLLAFEAGGVLTATQVHEDGLWQVKHRGGSQLLLALLDSLGNSGGILPIIFTVASGSSDCMHTLPTAEVIPTVTTDVTHIKPCDFWHLFITSGVPPYTIILASPGVPILRHFTAPQGSSTFSFVNNAIKLRGPTLASVRDSSGVFGQPTDFVETIDASGVSYKVKRLEERVGKLVLVARSPDGVKMSQRDTTIVAVCASVGGTMILAALCFAVVILRRRKRGLVAGQDARPRPFDTVIPASSINTSAPRVNVSVPLSVIDISWRNNWMASPTDASSTRSPVGPSPSRTHVRPLPVPAASRQSSNTSLRSPEDPHSRPPRKPSNSSMHTARSPHAGPSSRHPRPQQSSSSMRSANNSHPTNIHLPTERSTPAQEGQLSKPHFRSERHKRILHPSRSTGDIHNDNVTPPHRQHRTMPRSTTNAHSLNQLRHYHSTSNITHAGRGAPEPVAVHQHRDRGDPPPPYHKL